MTDDVKATSEIGNVAGPPASCPNCDYSLRGLGERGRCPECGFEYDAQTRLHHRPVRSAIWICIAGFLLVFGLPVACAHGWSFFWTGAGVPTLDWFSLKKAIFMLAGFVAIAVIEIVRSRMYWSTGPSGLVLGKLRGERIVIDWADVNDVLSSRRRKRDGKVILLLRSGERMRILNGLGRGEERREFVREVKRRLGTYKSRHLSSSAK